MSAPRRSTRSRQQADIDEPAVTAPTQQATPVTSPQRKRKRSIQADTETLAEPKAEAAESNAEALTSSSSPSGQLHPTGVASGSSSTSPNPNARRNGKFVKLKRPTRSARVAAASASAEDLSSRNQGEEGEEDAEEDDAELGDEVGSPTSRTGARTRSAKSAPKSHTNLSLRPKKTVEDYILPPDLELWLQPSDAAKLRSVIQHFAADLLETPLPPDSTFSRQAGSSKAKTKGISASPSTLNQALDGRRITLRQLRAHASALRRPLLTPVLEEDANLQDHTAEAKNTTKSLRGLNLLISFIDEIATRARAEDKDLAASIVSTPASKPGNTIEGQAKVKDEILDDDLEALLEGETDQAGERADKSYALHMRLATGDYFTKAVPLSPQQAAELDTGLADLVAVESLPEHSSAPAQATPPMLGERIHRDVSLRVPRESIEELREKRLPKLKAVEHLYYGPYSSFAPTYDSSASSLSRAASGLLWRTKLSPQVRRIKNAWYHLGAEETKEDGETGEEKMTNIPPPPRAPEPLLRESLPTLSENSLDPDLIQAGLDQLDQDAAVQKQLESNAVLLSKLQACQWERLRRGYAKSKQLESLTSMGTRGGSIGELPEDEPSEAEQALAGDLYKGLGELIAMRPRSTVSLLPTQEQLHALSHSAALDPAFAAPSTLARVNQGYWGTLDPSLYSPDAPVRLAGKVSTIVPTFESSETVRLDDSGESLAGASAMSNRGVPLGVSRDSGKGMLDRLANVVDGGRGLAGGDGLDGAAVYRPPGPSDFPSGKPPAPPSIAASPLTYPRSHQQQQQTRMAPPTPSPQHLQPPLHRGTKPGGGVHPTSATSPPPNGYLHV